MKLDIEARVAAPAQSPAAPRVDVMQRNPERIAWLVVFIAFLICIALTVSLPLAARYYMTSSVDGQTGMIQAIGGTVQLTPANATLPNAVTDQAPLVENSWVETDQTSRAFVTFFDNSTAQVFPASRLLVHEMRRPRFGWSDLPISIQVEQVRGLVRYGAALPVAHQGNPDGRRVQFVVHTPNFDAYLNAGSYSIEVSDAGSQVSVREGSVVVRALDASRDVTVAQGQRLQVAQGQALTSPIPAAQDLIVGGDFSTETLPAVWQTFSDQGGDAGTINGSVGIGTFADRHAVQILRTGANQNSAITGIKQQIDKDVSDFHTLIISADVRLHNQSLSGGGYLSSEYPLILRMKYRDVNGSDAEWVHGFYYQNDNNNPTRDGEAIPRDQWIPFETGNLMEGLDPKPFRIVSIQIYASGWDYESYISGLRLTVE